MRSFELLHALTIVTLLAGVLAPAAQAQDAPAATTVPADGQTKNPDAEKVASLEKTVAALTSTVRQLTASQPKPDPTEQEREGYARMFQIVKDRAGYGCKKAGGKLRATVDGTGKLASVTCEW